MHPMRPQCVANVSRMCWRALPKPGRAGPRQFELRWPAGRAGSDFGVRCPGRAGPGQFELRWLAGRAGSDVGVRWPAGRAGARPPWKVIYIRGFSYIGIPYIGIHYIGGSAI